MNKTIILLLLLFSLICIHACSQTESKENIAENSKYTQALTYINEYYTNEDRQLLIKAKTLLDSISDDSNQIINTKISLFFLLGNYGEGVKYLKTIPDKYFYKPYQKEMYLNSMTALSERDTVKRQYYYNCAVLQIKKYLSEHQTDNQALAEFYYTQLRFTSKIHVLNEIDKAIKTNLYDNEFLSTLKETIKEAPRLP
jgi:hypothetical protein